MEGQVCKENEVYVKNVEADDKVLVSNVITMIKNIMECKGDNVKCERLDRGYEILVELVSPEDEELVVHHEQLMDILHVNHVRIRDLGIRVAQNKVSLYVLVLDHKQDLMVHTTSWYPVKRRRKACGIV